MTNANPNLKIVCRGKEVTFADFTFTRSVQTVPMSLACSYANTYQGKISEFVTGDSIIAYLGDKQVFTGTVDSISHHMTINQHIVSMAARSLVRNLVDCSIDLSVSGGMILAGTVSNIAKRLAAPFNVNVVNKSSLTEVQVPQYIFNYGQSPFSAIEIAARYTGVLLLDDEFGNLVISDVGTKSHSSGVALGVNVEEATTMFSEAQRYSDYYAVWATPETLKNNLPTAQSHGYASDPLVHGHRPFYFVSEQTTGSQDIAQARATYERNVRFGRGYVAQIIVDKFTDSSGTLWTPAMLLDVDLPQCAMPNQKLAISSVTFVGGLGGTHAILNVMPAVGLTPEPVSLDQSVFSLQPSTQQSGTPSASTEAAKVQAQTPTTTPTTTTTTAAPVTQQSAPTSTSAGAGTGNAPAETTPIPTMIIKP